MTEPAPRPAERPALRTLTLLERTEALGGREQAHLQLCRALAARGHHLHLRRRHAGDLEAAFAAVATTAPLRDDGIKVLHDRPLATGVGVAANVVATARTRPDVVYVPARLLLALGGAVAAAAGAGLVVHLHDPPRTLDRQDRLAAARVDRAIAVSTAQAAAWAAVGVPAERTVVVPNGVDLERFAPADAAQRQAARRALGVPTDRPVVAVVGRVVADKGVAVAGAAVARLAEQHPGAHLLVAGPVTGAAGAAERRALAAALPAGSHTVVGALDDPVAAYRAADVVAVPSTGHDSAPLVLPEALASGVPVVGTDVGGIPEVVGALDPALVVPAGDPVALAAALGRALAGDLGGRARALAEARFGPGPWVDGVEAALVAAADARRRARRRRDRRAA